MICDTEYIKDLIDMSGRLFSEYFLTEGIRATSEWRGLLSRPREFRGFKDSVASRFGWFEDSSFANEATTEQELIRPVLEHLGWIDYLPQQPASRGVDIPDHLLFADSDSKRLASDESDARERYQYALAIQESKRLGLPLDSRDSEDKNQYSSPHGQILRYLYNADTDLGEGIRWGILTNGSIWRLYDYNSRPRSEGYYEADLKQIIEQDDDDGLRIFYLFFCRDSFTLRDGATVSFLDSAIQEGRHYEESVAEDLSDVVFKKVFPDLINALADATDADLEEVRQSALILLYRLLFVLYAEDRGLLPVNDPRYSEYGMRVRVRDSVKKRIDDGVTFSVVATNYYAQLQILFQLIEKGDLSIGLPPYNGGLFASETAPLLDRMRLTDNVLAPIIYELSHTNQSSRDTGARLFVNYRDMSVQQLGTIYERLLEQEPIRNSEGEIVVRPNLYARKDSGSFFTPQGLVDLILECTLRPLAEERLRLFEERSVELASDRRSRQERRADLEKVDPADAVLSLRVLDPAMGSGHFLVSAVDFLSDYVADMIEYVPGVPEWLDGEYVSPLASRITSIREAIIARAQRCRWTLDESMLTDHAIVRRMVLKRCIYGVDKNPLTVELAKVSLWLHSFTVGTPLSFLDHHLRCGDSLVGLRVSETTNDLSRMGGLFASSAIAGAEASVKTMQCIEEISDSDITEVRRSASLFRDMEDATVEVRTLMDFLCGLRWMTAGMTSRERSEFETPIAETMHKLNGKNASKIYYLLANGHDGLDSATVDDLGDSLEGLKEVWDSAIAIARREHFFHWEVTFPGVWERWLDDSPEGGFDAVIGNPPWNKINLQEVEWFANRGSEVALAPTKATREKAIQDLRKQDDPLIDDFDVAKQHAVDLVSMVKSYGHYPLLSGGNIDIYSLFVERAMNLIKPDGLVALLTPNGIYSAKTAAKFFRTVSTSGRVSSLFDFENRRVFFKDVHASERFCVLAFGGEERVFEDIKCAFFLHDTDMLDDSERSFVLSIDDFAKVNPNTGTVPIFRTRRDAEITSRIYEHHPVLVDRSSGEEHRAWPVRYHTLFNMSSHSHLFRTPLELDADGFYPIQGNRWKRGEDIQVPLYEGKMVQAFDHRAASVTTHEGNLFRSGQPDKTLYEEHRDPDFSPRPRYWVDQNEIRLGDELSYFIAFKDITASTNARTMIASIVPKVGCGHTLPVLIPSEEGLNARNVACVLANLNSLALDYIARQKVPRTHLSWYIVEQLPVIAKESYARNFGNVSAEELIRDHVLRLTYTSHDMASFARDLGYDGEPFIWDVEERHHLRARLDALYFHLYGLSREDADYVMSTFTIVRKEDEDEFGSYRTRDLVLGYMNAIAVGDTESVVAI